MLRGRSGEMGEVLLCVEVEVEVVGVQGGVESDVGRWDGSRRSWVSR